MPSVPPEIAPPPETGALAALVANSNLVALALADHDRIQFGNAAFGRLFGRIGGLVGLPIVDLLVPESRAPVHAALQAPIGTWRRRCVRPVRCESARGAGRPGMRVEPRLHHALRLARRGQRSAPVGHTAQPCAVHISCITAGASLGSMPRDRRNAS